MARVIKYSIECEYFISGKTPTDSIKSRKLQSNSQSSVTPFGILVRIIISIKLFISISTFEHFSKSRPKFRQNDVTKTTYINSLKSASDFCHSSLFLTSASIILVD